MTSEPQSPADHRMFEPDAEVTATVTGRVVQSDRRTGMVVIEYLTDRGFQQRLVVETTAPGASVVPAAPITAEEIGRRRNAYRAIGDAFADPDVRAQIFAKAPYGGIDPQAVS